MSKIVASERQALANINRFIRELDASPGLQARLGFARAWYADRGSDGNWRFGPSKFIGYERMTAEEYLNEDPRDGRRTEKQLTQWFEEVPEGTELHEELSSCLVAFLEQYGKTPSAKVRISVSESLMLDWAAEKGEWVREEDFVDQIEAVVTLTRHWPKSAINQLRKRLAHRD
jgi:uncharacterized protein HemY